MQFSGNRNMADKNQIWENKRKGGRGRGFGHSHMYEYTCVHVFTANPTWGDIFECGLKAQSSKLERLFSLKRGKRDVRALSFEL